MKSRRRRYFAIILLGFILSLSSYSQLNHSITNDATSGLNKYPYHSPIQIIFKFHFEPIGSDGAIDDSVEARLRLKAYQEGVSEIEKWVLYGRSTGLKLSIGANGEFFEYVADESDQAKVKSWLSEGHQLGYHIHSLMGKGKHDWERFTPTSDEEAEDIWKSHMMPAMAAFPDLTFTASTPWDADQSYAKDLFVEYKLKIMGGGPQEIAMDLLGHYPMNPWRYAAGQTLKEDYSSPMVLIGHGPQIGVAEVHGPETAQAFQDQTSAHLKVMALQVHLERLLSIQRNLTPKVWTFGFLQHNNYASTEMDEEIQSITEFIKSYLIERNGPDGRPIAEFVNYDQAYSEFLRWEKAYPETSSFQYDGSHYPYQLSALATHLKASEEREVNFDKWIVSPTNKTSDPVYIAKIKIGNRGKSLRSAYLIWREDGRSGSFDISSEIKTSSRSSFVIINGESGDKKLLPANGKSKIGEVPLIIIPRTLSTL